jgi:hypothetical protein
MSILLIYFLFIYWWALYRYVDDRMSSELDENWEEAVVD